MQGKPFDSFMDHALMPIAILDVQLRFVKVNLAMAEADGMPAEMHVGLTLDEVLPNLSKRIQPSLVKVLKTREPVVATINGELARSSGEPHPWLAVCFPCGKSQITMMALDTTGRAIVKALQRSNHLLEVALADLERSVVILRQQAFRDSLTGLYNRRFLQEALDIELCRAKRKRWPVGLVMIDVDDFKVFNDTYGHAAGDSLLRAVATSLQASVRSNDVLCRYGGDEFSLMMPEASLENAIRWAGKWRSAAKHFRIEWDGKSLPCPTVSMGVAAYPACQTAEILFREADSALYAAKANGRDQVKSNMSWLSSVRTIRVGT